VYREIVGKGSLVVFDETMPLAFCLCIDVSSLHHKAKLLEDVRLDISSQSSRSCVSWIELIEDASCCKVRIAVVSAEVTS
jgi:hypothetical protein